MTLCIECHGHGCDSCAPPKKYKMVRITEDAHAVLRRHYAEDGATITDIASRLITGDMGDAYTLSRAYETAGRIMRETCDEELHEASRAAYDALHAVLDSDELEG